MEPRINKNLKDIPKRRPITIDEEDTKEEVKKKKKKKKKIEFFFSLSFLIEFEYCSNFKIISYYNFFFL
jgi:hypothetical protein